MGELVFLEPNSIKAVPFTTSKVIAESTGVGHRHVKKQISLHKSSLETFGLLVALETESTGGRPEEIIQLNEQQATLLVTFLKNTPVVVAFKTELVRQFYEMRTELQKRQIGKQTLKPTRRSLTDEIKANPDHGKWDYKLYTDLAYKMVTGKQRGPRCVNA
jgi:phage regulator Rha-like protein